MDNKVKAILTKLAMSFELVGYEKQAMDEVFKNWQDNPAEKRESFLSFWKSVPIGRRLYLEILANYTEPKRTEAVTFLV